MHGKQGRLKVLCCIIILMCCCLSQGAFADSKTITGVEAYTWYRGCTSTTMAMIFNYWGNHGFPNLYVQPSSFRWDGPGLWVIDWLWNKPYCPRNLVDEFAEIYGFPESGGSVNDYGAWPNDNNAVATVAQNHGYKFTFEYDWNHEYETFKDEIDKGRPVYLAYDATISGSYIGNHSVCGTGYDFNSTHEIRIYNALDTNSHIITCENENIYCWGRVIPQKDFYLLSGTLTDAQGSSVPGRIYAYETSGANLGNRVYVAANEIYKMALFPGNYNVYADAYPDVTYGSTRIRTPLQNIDMTKDETLNFQVPLYDFYHLTGKVTDINGVELANVSVQAYNNSGVCYSSARTDSNGIYNISLIAGTYFLNFRPPNNSGFLDKRLDNIQINNDFTQDTFLASSEQYKLSGTVTGISGIFDYITVYANEIGGTNYGSASLFDGAYEMALFPGTYRIIAYAYKYNYYDGNYIGRTSITAPYQTKSILDDAELDIQVPSYDFYHLSGKVTDINDVIQPNVNIQAYDSTGVCQGYITTNSNGNYDLLLIPGTYWLRITAPPATYPPFEIKRIVVSEDSTRNIRLNLEYTLLEEALALLAPNLDLALDVFDIIDQATSLNYDIFVQGAKGLLQIILNWAGSEMKVTLYEPNGSVYGEYQSTEPPINVEITNPTEGTWKCEVTAVDVPHDNYPFALVVGVTPNQSPVADANGPYSGVVDSPITFDAGNSYDPDGSISSYEWDWNNDGNYDESTDSATINHTWTGSYSGNVALRVKDNEGATDIDIASVVVETTVIDTTPPEVEIKFPQSDTALQDGITLMAVASDAYGIAEVYFCVREPGGANGIPIGYQDLAGTLNTSGEWECDFDTTQLPDGYYVVIAKAIDTNDNEGWSEPVPCNIRNWAVIEFLPASKIYRAGRTMPIKFSLRIAGSVDPTQPFVYNEGLEIRIYDTSGTILQTSLYGDTSTDYRIDTDGELYITNFKTSKTPAEYVVEIWRMSKNFLVGSFTFETVK